MELSDWDMAEDIDTKEDVYLYMEEAIKENDLETLFDVIGAIARSRGMAAIAKEAGLNRESLYKSLSRDGNPSFSTVSKVLDILGYKLQVLPKSAA
ncbi:MAG: putative addiction module antidote protein [Spirochaetaceae bacterium]|jgi:probable addiction module antidote protein|nr:putative addiction module antidote protein [Spirochaetaceae bacterium]